MRFLLKVQAVAGDSLLWPRAPAFDLEALSSDIRVIETGKVRMGLGAPTVYSVCLTLFLLMGYP